MLYNIFKMISDLLDSFKCYCKNNECQCFIFKKCVVQNHKKKCSKSCDSFLSTYSDDEGTKAI